MKLGRQEIQVIQRGLRERSVQVPLNKTWRRIHDELGIGNPHRGKLDMRPRDWQQLRDWASSQVGIDVLAEEIPTGDRLALSTRLRHEKWSNEQVFEGMVWVARRAGTIATRTGGIQTPPGVLAMAASEEIVLDQIDRVVIVENGAAARCWHQANIPPNLEGALLLYRGHGAEGKAAATWLKALPARIRKIGFFDFDPAGLKLALDYEVDAILVPADREDPALLAEPHNTPGSHEDQIRRYAQRPALPLTWQALWEWMTSDGRRCALMQENLVARRWPLEIIEKGTKL